MTNNPHVQQSVDLLNILPQLATGARCVVFTCIGVFDADPLGASKRDILDYTGLSRPTVESALRFLSLNEWITFEPSTKRYRCAKYYRYGGEKQTDVRELVPILQGERRADQQLFNNSAKKFLTIPVHDDDDCTKESDSKLNHHHHDLRDVREILATSGFQGKNLISLSESVPLETARAWSDWIAHADPKYSNPIGYAWACLSKDPHANPPTTLVQKRLKWWGSEYDKFVNR